MTADELNREFGRINDRIMQDIPKIIQTAGLNIQSDAKRDAPIDESRLRNSITAKGSNRGFTANVYTEVEYAGYQEFGTYKMRAQPYLMPAFDRHSERAQQAIDKLIKDSIK